MTSRPRYSFFLLLHFLLYYVTGSESLGSTRKIQVQQLGSVVVRRGRTAFLHPRDLVITLPATSPFSLPEASSDDNDSPSSEGLYTTRCVVEVVDDDPMTQRVGTLSPKVIMTTGVIYYR